MEGENYGVVKMKRAEIDTTAPFRSVKEAVMLFGERVLAGELIYANKLKEMQNEASENGSSTRSTHGNVTTETELEETKESLQKAKEESVLMATCLSALQEELERTKLELQQLKEQESEKQEIEAEIKDVEFIDMNNSTEFDSIRTRPMTNQGSIEFQKKRYVTFANPPSLARVMLPQRDAVLERHPSLKKKKKKPLIPLIGGIFSRKKKGISSEFASPRI